MASVPAQASVVVVGAGIVGNSLAHHLAELGWTDIVQVDKGPLPNPGGSTGHASNFIFPVDHSREITDLTLDSMRQYKELGVFTESGGFEVARTEERMQELRRRMASARAWGIESSLATPAEVVEKRGLKVVSDDGALIAAIDEALAAQPDVLAKIKDGKVQAAGAVIGAVMKAMKVQADAARVRELVLERAAQ